ncbi:MAG: hypothetical protein J6P44_09300 [Bacteroidales bacterium]|nr:hypothetical protein [Bacteroidales bacterium]
MILDIHAGFVLSYDISHTYNGKIVEYWYSGNVSHDYFDNYNTVTAGINLGFTVWYKQFGADFTYQSLFGDDVYCRNIGIRLAYKF